MWYLNTSIIFVAIISTGIIHGLHAISISIHSDKFEEDLSIHLGEPMDKCDNQEHENVQLVNMGLEVVRDNFIDSVHVKSINLENNKINNISPNAFKAVPNLTCLNIRRNDLSIILKKFLKSFKHKSLTKLNLAKTMPKENFYDYLFSSTLNEDISETSEINLPNVTHLDLSDNNLRNLPKCIQTSFPSLTHLYLSGNNFQSLEFIPSKTQYLYLERIDGFVNLAAFPNNIKGLFLNNNRNFYIPSEYENINTLSIRNCTGVLEHISYLTKKKLVSLDISLNNLQNIEVNYFGNTKRLKHLSLDQNSLSSLYFLAPLHYLTNLSIAYNNLINITLDFCANLKNLQTLNLRGNSIENIDKDAFLNLGMLEKLDLAENNLSTLPATWMNSLTSLRYLNLKSNLFSSIDNMSIRTFLNLNHLFLGNNSFIQIEMESLKKLPSSVIVHVSSINNAT